MATRSDIDRGGRREALRLAVEHLAELDRRIRALELRIEFERGHGNDCEHPERLLEIFRRSFDLVEHRRAVILSEIASR